MNSPWITEMLAEARVDQWHRSAFVPRHQYSFGPSRDRRQTSVVAHSPRPVAPRVGAMLIRAGSRLGGLEMSGRRGALHSAR